MFQVSSILRYLRSGGMLVTIAVAVLVGTLYAIRWYALSEYQFPLSGYALLLIAGGVALIIAGFFLGRQYMVQKTLNGKTIIHTDVKILPPGRYSIQRNINNCFLHHDPQKEEHTVFALINTEQPMKEIFFILASALPLEFLASGEDEFIVPGPGQIFWDKETAKPLDREFLNSVSEQHPVKKLSVPLPKHTTAWEKSRMQIPSPKTVMQETLSTQH